MSRRKQLKGDEIYLTRTVAAKLIDRIREEIAHYGGEGDGRVAIERIASHLERARLPDLEKCPSEAHYNPYIDNCITCAPRWGLVGPEVKIR